MDMNRIEKACMDKGLRMTEQRRVIARVVAEAYDHPDAEELYRRAVAVDPHISIATVYRTVKLFEDAGILERHDFRDGRARYEEISDHHDHLIDLSTGRVIARVLSESHDHPDVEALHKRATAVDPNISIATVYRTVRLFEEAGILAKHDFGDGRARYEETPSEHHDHLIDIQSGKVIEFHNDEIEDLQRRIAEKAGYRLVGHRLELFGVPLDGKNDRQK